MYLPELLVVTLREFLVERSVRVTAASEITAPDTSLTVPSTVPLLVDCALAGRAMPRQRTSVNNANIARREKRDSCNIVHLPFGMRPVAKVSSGPDSITEVPITRAWTAGSR
jgi:hypothetical protein